MEGHRLRVGALAWSSSLLSSGGRDKNIYQRDIRTQDDFVSKLSGHKSEVRFCFCFLASSLYMLSHFHHDFDFGFFIFQRFVDWSGHMITVSWHLEEMTTEYAIANLINYLNYPTALLVFFSPLALSLIHIFAVVCLESTLDPACPEVLWAHSSC